MQCSDTERNNRNARSYMAIKNEKKEKRERERERERESNERIDIECFRN